MERQAKDGTFYKQVGENQWQEVTREAKDGTVYKKVGADQWTPVKFDVDAYSPENIEKTKAQSTENVKQAGNVIMDYVVDPVLTAIDYPQAPVRQILAAPAKMAKGDIVGALADPILQLGKSPKTAPTSAQVAEMYGTLKEKSVSPAAVTNPLMASTYENDPLEDDASNETIYPSSQVGALLDAATGTVGIDSIAKGAKAADKFLKVSEKVSNGASKLKSKISQYQQQKAAASAQAAAKAEATIQGGGISVEQGGKLFEVKAPQSLDELKNWKPKQGQGELIGKTRLREIENTITDLETKPLKYHYDMMENPKAMKELKLQFENLPTDDAKRIAAYNQNIIDESARKVQETINSISGKTPKNLSDAGENFIATVKEQYKNEKKQLGPVFEQLKKSSKPISQDEAQNLALAIGDNSKVGKLLDLSDEGRLFLKKNTPRTGLSDTEHGAISRIIDDLNDGMTFKELQDSREFLRKMIDPKNPGATSEINQVRKIMLEQLELMAENQGVGAAFKAYAKNERAREAAEKVIGGKIDTLDQMFAANPDKALGKIFANPNYAKTMEAYVGPDKMQEMVAAYVNNGISKSYDSAKGFDPSAVRNWLKSNKQFVTTYLDEETAKRLNALADYGYYGKRFLDEVNPSGTAASVVNALEPKNFMQKVKQQGIVGAVRSESVGRVETALSQRQAKKSVNEMLGGKPPKKEWDIKGTAKKVGENADAGFQIASRMPKSFESVSLNVADNKKGEERWAQDGIKNLIEHDSSLSKEILEKIKNDKKGKQLLFEAQSAKPGSKQMENITKKIRTGYIDKGAE